MPFHINVSGYNIFRVKYAKICGKIAFNKHTLICGPVSASDHAQILYASIFFQTVCTIYKNNIAVSLALNMLIGLC